jgi:4-hydroxy-3-polyprenylbenzoate decarboxylase
MTVKAHQNVQPMTAPFESMRDFAQALEHNGRLLRIPEMDQDQYEASAFAYRLIERMGFEAAPAFLIERIKIDGRWIDGPVVANFYGDWQDEALPFGIAPVQGNRQATFKAVMNGLLSRLTPAGTWHRIAPVVIPSDTKAPCQSVVVRGDAIDLTQFPFLKNNPADGGRYINMGAVVLEAPGIGRNVGTYRCQLKGPHRIGVNPEPGQHGWQMLMSLKRQGAKSAPCAVVLGADPITFAVSSSKFTGLGEDEYEIAGGLRGKAVELVKCVSNDLHVPAHAEMIIEGVIPLDATDDEGPYGEMYGYLGPKKANNFYMDVTAVTHRPQPWFANSFTGVTCDMPKGPQTASEYNRYKKLIPNLTAFYGPRGASGVVVVAIDKRMPGEGMMAGQLVAANPGLNKVVIVVDKDVDVLSPQAVMHVLGARWQPSASLMIPQTQMMMPDPSAPKRGLSSKMVIDATRQLPDEGGPKDWPANTRTLLQDGAPHAFDLVDARWDQYWKT